MKKIKFAFTVIKIFMKNQMQDRTNLTPELMERMRKELVELLSKYVEMDKEALELNLEQDGDQMALMLSIPVLRAKDEAEIEQAIAQEKAESDAETQQTSEEEKDIAQVDENDNTHKCEDYDEDCAECNECEISDDVECEIKKKKKANKNTEKIEKEDQK